MLKGKVWGWRLFNQHYCAEIRIRNAWCQRLSTLNESNTKEVSWWSDEGQRVKALPVSLHSLSDEDRLKLPWLKYGGGGYLSDTTVLRFGYEVQNLCLWQMTPLTFVQQFQAWTTPSALTLIWMLALLYHTFNRSTTNIIWCQILNHVQHMS